MTVLRRESRVAGVTHAHHGSDEDAFLCLYKNLPHLSSLDPFLFYSAVMGWNTGSQDRGDEMLLDVDEGGGGLNHHPATRGEVHTIHATYYWINSHSFYCS